MQGKYGSATYSDNFIVRHKPACPDMHGLAVDSIVADSARLFVDNLGAAKAAKMTVVERLFEPDRPSATNCAVTVVPMFAP